MSTGRGGTGETVIRVRPVGADEPRVFEVSIQDRSSETRHQVSMSKGDFGRFGGNATPEECVRAAFLFLLDREPKDSILSRFDFSVIASYFPEFMIEFPKYRDGLK